MANLTVTAANVLSSPDDTGASGPFIGTVAVDVTQGQPVYQDPADNLWKLGDATTALKAGCTAITLAAAKAGQPCTLKRYGTLTPGATLVKNKQYVVSHTSGLICPVEDVTTSGDFIQYLFFAISTTQAVMNCGAQGALVAN